MGSQPSYQERDTDLVEWQHRNAHFKDYSHRLGNLVQFIDSAEAVDIDARMGDHKCQEEEDQKFSAEDGEVPRAIRDTSGVRNLVSRYKKRIKREPFDLDLAYITSRIIAMGFPATGVQRTFRNSRDDVISFLATYHPTHHKVYNLCIEKQRYYSAKDFPNIKVSMYPIKDHYPASIYMIYVFCLDAYFYMRENAANVIAVHCKAGKGRTGLMITSFLLFNGTCPTAAEAIKYYGKRRAYDWVGISIPSQIQCIEHFEKFLICEFGTNFTQQIDRMVLKYDIICQRLTENMTRPYKLISLQLAPLRRIFNHKAIVSIHFHEQDRDFTTHFYPYITGDSVDFRPSEDLIVSGDFCIDFIKTFLKFKIWVNPQFFSKDISGEFAAKLGVIPEECISEEFLFHRPRDEIGFVGSRPVPLPKKSLSDFDKFETKNLDVTDMKLTVVCSKVIRNQKRES